LFEQELPPGLRYRDNFITEDDEQVLLDALTGVAFSKFEMRGVVARRRVAFFGQSYDGAAAVPIPAFLLPLRTRIAEWAGVDADAFAMALINEYRPGAGIGWHRDKAVFGQVVGVSLLAPCVLRFRRKMNAKWDRVNVLAERRSGYHLTGPARAEWEHSILRVDALRYSITFRTMREE